MGFFGVGWDPKDYKFLGVRGGGVEFGILGLNVWIIVYVRAWDSDG